MSEFSAVLSGSAVTFSLRVGAAFTTYVTQILLARWMGAGELGIYVYALSWLWILSLVATAGLAAAANRFVPAYLATGRHGYVNGYTRRARAITGLCSVLVGMGAAAVTLLVYGAELTDRSLAFLLAYLAIPFAAAMMIDAAIARAHLWFALAALTNMFLRPFLFLCVVVALFLIGTTLSAATAMMIFVAVVIVVFLLQFFVVEKRLKNTLTSAPPLYETRTWVRTALPLLVVQGFVFYFADLSVVVIGLHVSPEQLAIYNAAIRTVGLVSFGLSAVGLIAAPYCARHWASGDIDALRRLMTHTAMLMFWPSLVALIGLAVVGRLILGFFGGQFIEGYGVLMILASSQLFVGAVGPVASLLSVTGHQDRCLVVFAWATVAMILLMTVLVPAFGIMGGAVSVVGVTALWTTWLYVLAGRHLNIRPNVLQFRRPRQPV